MFSHPWSGKCGLFVNELILICSCFTQGNWSNDTMGMCNPRLNCKAKEMTDTLVAICYHLVVESESLVSGWLTDLTVGTVKDMMKCQLNNLISCFQLPISLELFKFCHVIALHLIFSSLKFYWPNNFHLKAFFPPNNSEF